MQKTFAPLRLCVEISNIQRQDAETLRRNGFRFQRLQNPFASLRLCVEISQHPTPGRQDAMAQRLWFQWLQETLALPGCRGVFQLAAAHDFAPKGD
jgi:hypothetical protein